MKRSLLAGGLAVVIVAAVAVVALASSGGGSSSSGSVSGGGGGLYGSAPAKPQPVSAPSGDAGVRVADHGLGSMLVDGQGRTLYLWKGDTGQQSMCSGGCAQAWPALTTKASVRAGAGVDGKLLGLSKRADGMQQVTYAGHPLYRFAGDTAPGQENGQGSSGFGALWWVVSPTGAAITTAG